MYSESSSICQCSIRHSDSITTGRSSLKAPFATDDDNPCKSTDTNTVCYHSQTDVCCADQRKILDNLYSREDRLNLKCKEIELLLSCKKQTKSIRPSSSPNFLSTDGTVGHVINRSAPKKPVSGLARPLTARKKYQHKVLFPPSETGLDSQGLIEFAVRICLPDFVLTKKSADWEEIRVKTLSSWCLHPLVGYFFPDDNSIALYEEHCSVRSPRSLPFLHRQPAVCFWGRKAGLCYTCVDLIPETLLYLGGFDLSHLPDVLRACILQTGGILCVRIVRVDARSRQIHLENVLEMAGVGETMLFTTLARMHISRLDVKPLQKMELLNIQRRLRCALRRTADPVVTYLGLVKYFQALSQQFYEELDSESSFGHCQLAYLNREELEYGLVQAGFYLDQQEMDLLFAVWENISGRDGEPTASEFLQLAFGDVPEDRRHYIAKAFMKMDPACLGQVKIYELLRFYSLPLTLKQDIGPEVAHDPSRLFSILQDLALTPGRVDFSEFLAYYTAVSHTIGDPIVDFVSTDEDSGAEDDANLLMNLVFSSSSRSSSGGISPQSMQTDAFAKLICLAWRV